MRRRVWRILDVNRYNIHVKPMLDNIILISPFFIDNKDFDSYKF